MCSVDHLFEHNFYVVLIFQKRMLTFQENCIFFRFTAKNRRYVFFLPRKTRIFVRTGSKILR